MRPIGLLVLTCSLLTSFPTSSRAYFDTANDLYALCRSSENIHRAVCTATISGAVDMMQAWGWECQVAGVTREQLKDVVTKYLVENPEIRNDPAVIGIALAMQRSFGCVQPSPR